MCERQLKSDCKQQMIKGKFNTKISIPDMSNYLQYQINQHHTPTHLYSTYKCIEQDSICNPITILSPSTGIVSSVKDIPA